MMTMKLYSADGRSADAVAGDVIPAGWSSRPGMAKTTRPCRVVAVPDGGDYEGDDEVRLVLRLREIPTAAEEAVSAVAAAAAAEAAALSAAGDAEAGRLNAILVAAGLAPEVVFGPFSTGWPVCLRIGRQAFTAATLVAAIPALRLHAEQQAEQRAQFAAARPVGTTGGSSSLDAGEAGNEDGFSGSSTSWGWMVD